LGKEQRRRLCLIEREVVGYAQKRKTDHLSVEVVADWRPRNSIGGASGLTSIERLVRGVETRRMWYGLIIQCNMNQRTLLRGGFYEKPNADRDVGMYCFRRGLCSVRFWSGVEVHSTARAQTGPK